jgi:hypothetical protein
MTGPVAPVVVAAAPWWSSITAGDWLQAVLNAVSIFAAIMIASFITPRWEERKARRDQRERLLRVMLHTWPTPANPDWQSSITLIPFDFKGCKAVLGARQAYLDTVNRQPPTEEEAATAHFDEARTKQAALIAAVANELGFNITPESFLSGIYVSKGFTDRENLTLNAMFAWQRIATALERNNEMFAATLQSTTPSKPNEEDAGPDAKT